MPIGVGAVPGSGVGGVMTLNDYLADLRFLLHDPNDVIWTTANKTMCINKGLQRRDLDTFENRLVIPFTLTPAKDTYTLTDLGNVQVFDVISIALIYGNTRYVLGQMSLTALNIGIRQWVPAWQWAPIAVARVGPNTFIFGPAPSIAYATEWDCCQYANPLVNLTDTDPMPYPFTAPVPFYAAYYAKLNERQYDEANDFQRQYREKITEATNSRVGMVPGPYAGGTMVWV